MTQFLDLSGYTDFYIGGVKYKVSPKRTKAIFKVADWDKLPEDQKKIVLRKFNVSVIDNDTKKLDLSIADILLIITFCMMVAGFFIAIFIISLQN